VTVHAVAVNKNGEYLVLQRAKHRSNAGSWNCVTGFIRDRESAQNAALRELKEETNLSGKIIKTTKPFCVDIDDVRWVVISSLIKADNISELKVDKNESQNYKWIRPSDKIVEESKGLKASFVELGIIQ